MRSRTRQIVKRLFPVCFLGLVAFVDPVLLLATETDGHHSLPVVYEKWKKCLGPDAPDGMPLRIESADRAGRIVGRVYGLFDEDIGALAEVFCDPACWGEIAILHLNVKGFALHSVQGRKEIVLYVGRKHYEPLSKAHRLRFAYEVETVGSQHIEVSLTGGQGIWGGRKPRLRLEAVSVGSGQSFACMTYSCGFGVIERMMVSGYLQTLGRKKIGFSVVGADEQGRPIYVRGTRGMLERNAVRYYLAVKAYLDTRHIQAEDRFERRLNRWFDLTGRYHAQLYEYDRTYYLACKKKEWENTRQLQRSIEERAMAPRLAERTAWPVAR